VAARAWSQTRYWLLPWWRARYFWNARALILCHCGDETLKETFAWKYVHQVEKATHVIFRRVDAHAALYGTRGDQPKIQSIWALILACVRRRDSHKKEPWLSHRLRDRDQELSWLARPHQTSYRGHKRNWSIRFLGLLRFNSQTAVWHNSWSAGGQS
jgi:hypothetical protein